MSNSLAIVDDIFISLAIKSYFPQPTALVTVPPTTVIPYNRDNCTVFTYPMDTYIIADVYYDDGVIKEEIRLYLTYGFKDTGINLKLESPIYLKLPYFDATKLNIADALPTVTGSQPELTVSDNDVTMLGTDYYVLMTAQNSAPAPSPTTSPTTSPSPVPSPGPGPSPAPASGNILLDNAGAPILDSNGNYIYV